VTSSDALVPDPLISDRQFARFNHLDLSELENEELTDELHALRPLLRGLPPEHWIRQRVLKLEHELAKRRGDISFRSSGRPKPKPAEGVKL
jgi:hypothetical protein